MMKHIYTLVLSFILMMISLSLLAQDFQWVKGGGGIGDNDPVHREEATDYLATDEHGNVYAASVVLGHEYRIGSIWDTVRQFPYSRNITVFSLDCDGKVRWNKMIESKSFYDNFNSGLLYDNNNGVYWSGAMVGQHIYIEDTILIGAVIRTETSVTGPLLQNIHFLIKYDTLGNFKWLRFINTPTHMNSRSLTIDPNGSIHIFQYSIFSGDTIVPGIISEKGVYDIAYSPSGSLLHAKKLDLDSTWMVSQVAFHKDGKHLFVLGRRNTDLVPGSGATFIAVFDEHLNRKWFDTAEHLQIKAGKALYSAWSTMTYDQEDYLYVLGAGLGGFKFRGDSLLNRFNHMQNDGMFPGGYVSVRAKIDVEGNIIWIKKNDGTGTNGFVSSIQLPDQKLAAAGMFSGMVIGEHGDTLKREPGIGAVRPFFIVMDSSGHIETIRAIKANDRSRAAAITAFKNNLYIGGDTKNSVWADTNQPPYQKYGGPTDFFVLKYGYPCNCEPPATAFNYTIMDSMQVRLQYSGSQPIDSVLWNFGDGASAQAQNPEHTYSEPGDYYICATAYNSCGGYKVCKRVSIHKECPPPVPSFTYETDKEKTTHFEYTGSYPVDSIVWYFGDDNIGKGQLTTHKYAAFGDYHVCAIAYNDCGSQSYCEVVHIDKGVSIAEANSLTDTKIYPNPTTDQIQVENVPSGSKYRLYQSNGAIVDEGMLPNGKSSIHIENLAPGIYVLELWDQQGVNSKISIVKIDR